MRCRRLSCVEPTRTFSVALHWMQHSEGSRNLGMLISAGGWRVRSPNPTKASLVTCNPIAAYRLAFSEARQLLRSKAALHN
jgi:hypothetical protein